MDIPAAALDGTKDNVAVKIVETTTDTNVTVASDESAKTFEIIVELRLTNPADYSDSIAVNTVTYCFGNGNSSIVNYGE